MEEKNSRKITIRYKTTWTKVEVSIIAYFIKNNNKPASCKDIAMAYIKSDYSHYLSNCKKLEKKGYLVKEEDKFMIRPAMWPQMKKGKEAIEVRIPHLDKCLEQLKKRNKK